jgi:hypothetical protein
MIEVKMNSRRRAIVVSISAVATAILASSVIAGQFRGSDPEAFHAGLATGEIARVADIAAGDGLSSRGVFVQATDTGQLCLWDARSASSLERQGGCNSVDDPLGGSALSASLAFEGGPAVGNVQDARLIGLASREVAAVQVLMSDGTQREVRLRKAMLGSDEYRAFGYRFKKLDLRGGIGPTAVIARSATGDEIARQPTGIGG